MSLDEKIEVNTTKSQKRFDTVKEAVEYVNMVLLEGNSITGVNWVYVPTGKTKNSYDKFFREINSVTG